VYNREENLRNAFNKFDIDGSGKISIDELKVMLGGEEFSDQVDGE
jgi:Ca2+-binding EF-hand superfamily protein